MMMNWSIRLFSRVLASRHVRIASQVSSCRLAGPACAGTRGRVQGPETGGTVRALEASRQGSNERGTAVSRAGSAMTPMAANLGLERVWRERGRAAGEGANHGLKRPCAVTALRDASISPRRGHVTVRLASSMDQGSLMNGVS
ncbi:hypothetical protein FALCPG4_001186 [Fusarium falciforme]